MNTEDQLPQEWADRIYNEAIVISDGRRNNSDYDHGYINGSEYGYETGATAYALRAYKAEQEVERLKQMLQSYPSGAYEAIDRMKEILTKNTPPQTKEDANP